VVDSLSSSEARFLCGIGLTDIGKRLALGIRRPRRGGILVPVLVSGVRKRDLVLAAGEVVEVRQVIRHEERKEPYNKESQRTHPSPEIREQRSVVSSL
jgi:hypothetical protein